MESRRYPSDLSDAQWPLLQPLLPTPKRRGRPRLHSPREILNAVFYVLKTGCQWRMLPREFPPSIHRVADKALSRKPIFTLSNAYASGPGLRADFSPKKRF